MKGIRNLEKRLNSNFDKTLDELQDEGFIICEYGDRLSGVLCEDSGTCIMPSNQSDNTPCEWLVRNGYSFGLDYYTLFSFDEDENGEFVDFQSIECFDFQRFADELGDLLEKHGVIMQTHKYKKCYIAPAPKCVFYDDCSEIEIFKPAKIDYRKMKKIVEEIHDLAYMHLFWQMTSERREKAKVRLANIKAIQAHKRRKEYAKMVLKAQIPQRYFDLVSATISSFSSSQGFYERLERQIQSDDFALRNLAFQAMRANAKDPVDIIMMMEAA